MASTPKYKEKNLADWREKFLKSFEGPQPEKLILTPSELTSDRHGSVLCYPGTDVSSFDSRLLQLKKLGVTELILEGSSKVGKFGIIGKGCVSIVVKARMDTEKDVVALKIRRADANRIDTSRDHELQSFANSFGVGPKAISHSKDLFAMEYIDSMRLGSWFSTLKTRTPKKYTRSLIQDILKQCYLLDVHGLDHGELSNPTKHILLRRNSGGKTLPSTVIIDYESASRDRRVSNLTAVSSFFFLGRGQSQKLRKIVGLEGDYSREELVQLLRHYKEAPSIDRFENILLALLRRKADKASMVGKQRI